MSAADPTEIRMHFTGSPSVEAIGGATTALRRLIDAIAKRAIPVQVEARCVCDQCGAKSEPVDLTRPDDAEATLREAGWARDTEVAVDTCPACVARGGRRMSAPYYADDSVTLWHGDCLEVMRTLPDASVDSIVTDPPYGLGFMGRAWDDLPPGLPWAQECLRVLKPGGHILAFGGTRTWHRLACAIEDAGFEMRDSIAWLYGSGFPKSLDVSKAIDRRANVNDETRRRIALVAEVIRSHREAKGMERAAVSLAVVGTPSGACWNWEHQQLPSVEMWPAIRRTLDIPDRFDGLIDGDRAQFIAAEREVIGAGTSGAATVAYVRDAAGDYNITAPATPDAARWQGWGTALKPAFEPVVVARKPLAGTVAANVLAWGTGALNVDGCRIHSEGSEAKSYNVKRLKPGATLNREGGNWRPEDDDATRFEGETKAGRWPTNVILEHLPACDIRDEGGGDIRIEGPCAPGCPVAELDRQSGNRPGFASQRHLSPSKPGMFGAGDGSDTKPIHRGHDDQGGASRFFPTFRYEAKAPTLERPRVDGIAHATVKPVDLMRWLVRLVTPPGGLVLDPFAGSGTTAEACVVEGFRCVLIEREADYLPLIVARLSKPIQVGLDFGGAA